MFEWLRKLGKNKFQNNAGLSDDELDMIRDEFVRIEIIKKDLPNKLLRYVVNGTGEEVLSELYSIPEAYNLFGLVLSEKSHLHEKRRCRMYCRMQSMDLGILHRLSKVYLTAIGTHKYPFFYDKHMEIQTLILESMLSYRSLYVDAPENYRPTATDVENLLKLNNESPSDIIKMFCYIDNVRNCNDSQIEKLIKIHGLAESIMRYPEEIKNAFTHCQTEQFLHLLLIFKTHSIPAEPFITELVPLLFSTSKQVREAVTPLLYPLPSMVIPLLIPYLQNSKPSEKIMAAQWISKIGGDSVLPILSAHIEVETNEKVIAEINTIIGCQESKQTISDDSIKLPSLPEIKLISALPVDFYHSLKKFAELYNTRADNILSQKDKYERWEINSLKHISDNSLKKIFDLIQGNGISKESYDVYEKSMIEISFLMKDVIKKQLIALVSHPEFQLIHLVRFMLLFKIIYVSSQFKWTNIREGIHFKAILMNYNKSHSCNIGLRELTHALSALNIDGAAIGWERLESSYWRKGFNIDDNLTWPFFADNMHLTLQALGLEQKKRQTDEYISDFLNEIIRKEIFRIISMFPVIPKTVVPYLWEIALGTSKKERPLAMACLEKVPGKSQVLINALAEKRQDTRLNAAEWLGRFQVKEAVAPLHDALKIEKNEAVKAAILNALQRLGISLGEMIDREALNNEATTGLKKGIPPALGWFPFDSLPKVHWSNTNDEVKPDIIKWWLVSTAKIGSPEPTELLCAYGELLIKKEREALAKFILDAWLSYDTIRKYTIDEAADLAKKDTVSMKQQIKQYPQYYPDWTEEKHYRAVYNYLMDVCKGSAIKEKGILAIVGAFGGDDIAGMSHKYIKYWFGNKIHQCKALIHMLSRVNSDSAIQLLLMLAIRFRTKSIQQEAEICVNEVAERKKWTVDEMADRTIPTAGFDDGSELILDYGNRKFRAIFNDDGIINLFDEEGNIVKALPDARKDEDEEKIKEIKKTVSNAKKEIKNIFSIQKSRLYEAMCTRRSWLFADWQAYLLNHPIMRLFCQRVVWQTDGQPGITFRPLNDGTLTDQHDNEVTLNMTDIVCIAHSCTISDEDKHDWQQHFKDYEVEMLFDQFSRPLYELPADMKEETEIVEFQGYMTEAFKLRGKANNFGYTRGQVVDSGWFYTYSKRFPGLKIEAVIEFTGNGLPEENIPVALKTLSFIEILNDKNEDNYTENHINLEEIPPVLLSECWNDLRIIAADGSGYDKDWEKKSS